MSDLLKDIVYVMFQTRFGQKASCGIVLGAAGLYLLSRPLRRSLSSRKDPKDKWERAIVDGAPYDIRALGNGSWEVQSSILWCGVALPRSMFLYRIPGTRDLVVHSAMAVPLKVEAEIARLGSPKYVIVPCKHHRRDIAAFKERYPDALVVCPEAVKQATQEVIGVDGTCEEVFGEDNKLGVHIVGPPAPETNLKIYGGLLYSFQLVEKKDDDGNLVKPRALVTSDLVFNLGPGCSFLQSMLIAAAGVRSERPGILKVSRGFRHMIIKSRPEVAKWWDEVRRDAEGSVEVISVAHGPAITGFDECHTALGGIQNEL